MGQVGVGVTRGRAVSPTRRTLIGGRCDGPWATDTHWPEQISDPIHPILCVKESDDLVAQSNVVRVEPIEYVPQ